MTTNIVNNFVFINIEPAEEKNNRPEQKQLRKYLLETKPWQCIFCIKKYPKCMLDTAHLKPYHLLIKKDKEKPETVELMCKSCHSLYDNGLIGVEQKGKIIVSEELKNYNIIKTNKKIQEYTPLNKKYFKWHRNTIFRKSLKK
jgi:predicted restriction endonuclease